MKVFLLVIAVLASSGCALKTQTVRLNQPTLDRVTGALKPIVIDAVVDQRDFRTIPEGSGPRLDPKIAEQLGIEGRASAISGMPKGGLVTQVEKSTVSASVSELIENTLHNKGYRVIPSDQASADTPRMTVKVEEFWCYMPFNFGRSLTWTMQMKAWISTTITLKTAGQEREFTVSGYGAHIVQTYSTENIQQAYDIASSDYRSKLEAKMFSSL